jgi:hypothetical protein
MKRIIICLLILSANASAQWSNDPAVNVRVTNEGLFPKIISDGNGGGLIVYSDAPAYLGHLWIQRIDKHGYVRFPGEGVSVSGIDTKQTDEKYLFSDGSGGVIIVFVDFERIGEFAHYNTYAQRIDSSGVKLWGEDGIDISLSLDESTLMSAISDGENGVLIFWLDNYRSYTKSVYDLRMQRINRDGERLINDNGILISNYVMSSYLRSKNTNSGTFVIYSELPDTTKFDSIAKIQRINRDGDLLWGNGLETSFFGNMTGDGLDGVIIAGYHSYVNDSGYPDMDKTAAQRIDKDGNQLWGDNGVLISENFDTQTLFVKILPVDSGNFVFTWQSRLTGKMNVYAQKLNINGELQWLPHEIALGDSSADNKFSEYMAVGGDGSDIIIVMNSENRDAEGLYGQKIDTNGNLMWGGGIFIHKLNTHYITYYSAATDNNGGAIACWDETGSRYGIFAQQISKNGILGDVKVTSVKDEKNRSNPREYKLYQSYPNPFNSSMNIRYRIPKTEHVKLTIYSISGEEVTTLINREQAGGEYVINWNGKGLDGNEKASGIYFYQLTTGRFRKIGKSLLIK